MTLASISMVPEEVNTLPFPQLNKGSSSIRETAWQAALRAVEPDCRSEWVEVVYLVREAAYWMYREGGRWERVMEPAPPWRIRVGM